MVVLVVILILLSNYVAVSTISDNSKTVYFTIVSILTVLGVVLKVL